MSFREADTAPEKYRQRAIGDTLTMRMSGQSSERTHCIRRFGTLVAAVLTLTTPPLAWHDGGHKIAAPIAFHQLSEPIASSKELCTRFEPCCPQHPTPHFIYPERYDKPVLTARGMTGPVNGNGQP